uniref:Uncharacterized protein n=1 Tax=Plectus sambesii TaxID=2011161 RepID=A0A914VGH9_9BILA
MSATNASPATEPMRKAWSFHRVLEMQKFRQNKSERNLMVANNFNFLHRLSQAHIGSDLRDQLAQVSDEMRSRLQSDGATSIDKPVGILKKLSEGSQKGKVAGAAESPTINRQNRMSTRDNRKRLKQRMRLLSKSCSQSTNEYNVGGARSLLSLSFDSSSPPPFAVSPSVIIVGAKQTGKSTIIRAVQECQSARVEECDTNGRRGSANEPLFIEVNCQKDDLWSSITTHAFVVVFSTDKADSQALALDCLAMLRTRQSTCHLPVFLVVNMVRPSCDHYSLKEAKNTATRYNTPFVKISPFAGSETSNVEALTDWLHTDLYNPHPFSSRKETHHRKISAGRSVQARRTAVGISQLSRRASRSCEDLLLLRQKLSITK